LSKIFLGIDPGQTGCLAMIQPAYTWGQTLPTSGVGHVCVQSNLTSSGELRDDVPSQTIRFFDPPLFQVQNGKKIKNEYNEIAMARALKEFSACGTEVVVILEKVSAMPGQGVTSMFNFGMGFGLWRGMLSAFEIPYSLVHPATWKSVIMRDMPKEKDAARMRAIQLYPQAAVELSRKRDIGRADALLLAHYGILTQTQSI
jgi:crossover junction endodeoxyribonuclease RuvC